MIKKHYILIVIFGLFISCNTLNNIHIIVNDNNSIDKINVLSLSNNDTIILYESKPNLYIFKNTVAHQTLLIIYKQKIFRISGISKDVKSIFINYSEKAENNCYVIHYVGGDAIQSTYGGKLTICSAVTNIYVYNKYYPDNNIEQHPIELRIKN